MEGLDWKVFVTVVALLWSVLNSFWTRYVAAQSVNRQSLDDLTKTVAAQDHEITVLNATVAQLPSKDFVHRMEKNQVRMEGDINLVKQQLGPIGTSVSRIEDFLISEARSKP